MQFDSIDGYFGEYGGVFAPEELKKELKNIDKQYQELKKDPAFIQELHDLYQHYSGRPTPTYFAKNLSEQYGAQIYLKREDLNHTGAHKLNHCLGEVLLAKKMGKKKVIAETGAGQHGVALATAATLLKLDCDIYMGAVDMEKEKPNVTRMKPKLLGARVIQLCKEAVRLQRIPKRSFMPSATLKGSQADRQLDPTIWPGLRRRVTPSGFSSLRRKNARSRTGKSFKVGEHAATLSKGSPGILHGGSKAPSHEPARCKIASGLDYPGIYGPVHSYFCLTQRYQKSFSDKEALARIFHPDARVKE